MSRTGQVVVASLLAVGLAAAAAGRETHPPGAGVPQSIRHFEVVTSISIPGGGGGASFLPNGGATNRNRLDVSFHTLGKAFDLELELNELFTADAKNVWIDDTGVVEETPQHILYRGRVKGEPDSWVRVSVEHGILDGMVYTPDEIYFIEPAARFFDDAAPGTMIAYRISDTDSEWLPGSCAVQELPQSEQTRLGRGEVGSNGMAAFQALAAALRGAGAATTLEQGDLGLVADYEYFQNHGANSAQFMQNIINQVDGVYQAEVGVNLRVTETVVYQTSSDPFSGVTSPSGLLSEFSAYRNANDNSPGDLLYGTDLAHLFTGRNLDGNVIGIAWLGSVCSSYYGAGLSQDFTTSNKALVLLSAHEIGHNFDAPHDNQGGSACGHEPWGFIMNPSISTSLSLQFSTCSKDMIAGEVAIAGCMVTVGDGTPTTTPTPTPTPTNTAVPTNTLVPTETPTVTPVGPTYTPTVTSTPTPTTTVPAVPAVPNPQSPSGTIADTTPTFQWPAVSGATQYWLAVYDTTQGAYAILTFVGTNTYTPATALDATHSYKWKLAAGNAVGWSPNSAWLWFDYEPPSASVPAVPSPQSPSGTIADTTPTFQWPAVSGATQYWLAVYDTTLGAYAVLTFVGTNTYTPATALDTTHSYKWKLAAGNAVGWSPNSAWLSFNYTSVPAVPSPQSPSGTIADTTPTFSWPAVSGATQYWLAVYDTTQGAYAILTFVGTNTYTPAAALDATHSYKWKLAAGNAVGWSPNSAWLPFDYL